MQGLKTRDSPAYGATLTAGRSQLQTSFLCNGHFLRLPVAPPLQRVKGESARLGKLIKANLGADMRIFLSCAIIISVAIGLGSCTGGWWHHQQAVVTKPLK